MQNLVWVLLIFSILNLPISKLKLISCPCLCFLILKMISKIHLSDVHPLGSIHRQRQPFVWSVLLLNESLVSKMLLGGGGVGRRKKLIHCTFTTSLNVACDYPLHALVRSSGERGASTPGLLCGLAGVYFPATLLQSGMWKSGCASACCFLLYSCGKSGYGLPSAAQYLPSKVCTNIFFFSLLSDSSSSYFSTCNVIFSPVLEFSVWKS